LQSLPQLEVLFDSTAKGLGLPGPLARAYGGDLSLAGDCLVANFVESVDGVVAFPDAAGESGAVKFESFQKVISQQASRILNEKGAQAVDFRLETKDGKVSLKAKPVR